MGLKGKVLTFAAAALAVSGLRADHNDFVIVNANASKAYTERKFAHGTAAPESYVLFQGKYFNGMTRDPSIDHAAFLAIAKTLAPDLAQQNYRPTRDAAAANLLIVINWGTTVTDPTQDKNDPETQFELQDLLSSVSSSNAADMNSHLAVADVNAMSQQSVMGYNSRLLGYGAALQREGRMDWARTSGASAIEESHLAELIDERYFVILLAYDYQKIQREHEDYRRAVRQAGLSRLPPPRPPPQPSPVWSVRMNIRAAGNNFNAALPAMGQAAAGYFGKQVDDLVDKPASVGSNAHVDVGETKVLNVVK